jgi:hypothetical protein
MLSFVFNRSATHSLKREHKRKFNRSLCGVLLGVSIVLVILGILGIIGIAVYLGGKITFTFLQTNRKSPFSYPPPHQSFCYKILVTNICSSIFLLYILCPLNLLFMLPSIRDGSNDWKDKGHERNNAQNNYNK